MGGGGGGGLTFPRRTVATETQLSYMIQSQFIGLGDHFHFLLQIIQNT